MKRRSSTTWGAIFLAFLMFFSIHYTTLYVPVSWSFPSNSTTPHEPMQLKSRRFLIPNKPNSTTGYPLAAAISEIITCDRSHYRYDVCSLNGPTLLDPTKSTLFLVDPTTSTLPHRKEKVRPYPRKWENSTMSHIKQLTLITSPAHTHCDYQHEAPALVFSTGGYTGNLFHDFNDGFVPLFVTVRSFFLNRAPVLVVANSHEWWLEKYAEVLRQFSPPYPVVNLDTERSTHCFTSVTVGLISHDYMTIDPKLLPNSETFLNFRALLGNAYLYTTNHFPRVFTLRPRLVLVSRTGNVGRVITNQDEVRKAAEEIGFEVAMFEPNKYTPMSESYGLINTSHAMLGVHGAALTHSLFLRPGSVFIQVVPIGIDWLAETCFGKSSREMGLQYMEYKISVNESSLLNKYGKDDIVLRNPRAVVKQTFANTKKIYLQKQDVQLDLVRVQKYLIKAHKKAARFMNKEG